MDSLENRPDLLIEIREGEIAPGEARLPHATYLIAPPANTTEIEQMVALDTSHTLECSLAIQSRLADSRIASVHAESCLEERQLKIGMILAETLLRVRSEVVGEIKIVRKNGVRHIHTFRKQPT